MKKLFIILLSALSLTAFGQEVKKVAILETVDKAGDVPYGVKLQVRMNLTYAISNTPGYEGYDRVDMASIMGEQNFQRTGMVSDAQIKRVGEMTGAQYVLIAEAALYDEQNIIITAKVLDVETGGVANSAPPAFANKSPDKMQEACVTLAHALLKANISPVQAKSSASQTSQPIIQQERKNETTVNYASKTLNEDVVSPSIPGYVDLGLPSGTLWKDTNEDCGFINYEQAIAKYGSSLPTKEQWDELKNDCKWIKKDDGYLVTGPNNQTIFLPGEGFQIAGANGETIEFKGSSVGMYWSSTPFKSKSAWLLMFNNKEIAVKHDRARELGVSIRLVK